ncbi:MAG: hypothetical protein OXH75_22065 [Acidobacteria bacterium]|nr:hypothetical protein [Acidobacteriota bacterium]
MPWTKAELDAMSDDELRRLVAQYGTGGQGAPMPAEDAERGGLGASLAAAGRNFLPSAGRAVSDVLAPIHSPIETARAVGGLAAGVVQKLIPGRQEQERYADAVGRYVADRYGSLEGLRRTFEEDPAGMAADLAGIFTGGTAAAARIPGRVGSIARAASRGAAVPARAAGQAAGSAVRAGGRGLATLLGTTSRTGQNPRIAFRAAREGGEARRAYLGDVPIDDVINDSWRSLDAVTDARIRTADGQPAVDAILRERDQVGGLLEQLAEASRSGSQRQAQEALVRVQGAMARQIGETMRAVRAAVPTLEPAIAGRAMQPMTSRATGMVTAGGAGLIGGGLLNVPAAGALVPLTSPRLVGMASYGAGRASPRLAELLAASGHAAPAAYAAGRTRRASR